LLLGLTLHSPVEQATGIGKSYGDKLADQGIFTVLDLLLIFPSHYIDFSRFNRTINIEADGLYCIDVKSARISRNFKKRLSVLRVEGQFSRKNIRLVFFNQPYLLDFFRKHVTVWIHGKFLERDNVVQMINPKIFTRPGERTVLPVYSFIGPLKSGHLRRIIGNILDALQDNFESLPGYLIEKYGFTSIQDSFEGIHRPDKYNEKQIEHMKKRFIYTEFLFFHLELHKIRSIFRQVERVHSYEFNDKVRESIENCLGFDLTSGQIMAFTDIINDLKSNFAMQRLLQGDVGVGKTVIAFLALLVAKENGYQSAFLAPTEILANQHFFSATRFYRNARIDIVTGSTSPQKKAEIEQGLRTGQIEILFGTHALLNEKLKFKNLSMIIIDEQHRFGVSQRAALYTKGKSVDLLVTTATPIPRTMLLTLFNDLQVSKIKSGPKGRKPIITSIVEYGKRNSFYRWLVKQITVGAKTYIVLPLIEKSDFFSNYRSIEEESDYYSDMFHPLPIGFITGKSSLQEKETVLKAFSAGELRIIICTTVIEVGIDVKDANMIVIEDADRYGLAQLHQLRGRVGRGDKQSYCFLHPSLNITSSGRQRLKTMVSTTDGFKIAETDLKMRGGGIVSGIRQTGFFDFRVGDIKSDYDVFVDARQDALSILEDPSLENDFISDYLQKLEKKSKNISFS
jgi:ATP-dependent DNA helicase RecG